MVLEYLPTLGLMIILNYFRGQCRSIFHTWILWDTILQDGAPSRARVQLVNISG